MEYSYFDYSCILFNINMEYSYFDYSCILFNIIYIIRNYLNESPCITNLQAILESSVSIAEVSS